MAGHGPGGKQNRKKREEALAFALVNIIALRTLTRLRMVKFSCSLKIRGQLTRRTTKVRQRSASSGDINQGQIQDNH